MGTPAVQYYPEQFRRARECSVDIVHPRERNDEYPAHCWNQIVSDSLYSVQA